MNDDAALAATTAALLDQGRVIDRLSWAATLAVLLALALGAAGPALLPALAAGLLQSFLAVRIGFDAALFRALATGSLPDLSAMDRALLRLGLIPEAKASRPMAPRAAGARRLLRLQAIAAAAQLALLLGGLALRG